ncbi:serine/threonine protein kinase [Streptomyces sp. NPDC005969]|uniref:serine/threonine protein kinase n=1 Tax=Streptomyces sp. NPDC005969 TaxID=3156722 RepID=UPI0033D1C5C3
MHIYTKASITALTAMTVALGTATSASAATNPVSACGSGYYVQEKKPLVRATLAEADAVVYLLYNASTGYNCVVTVHQNRTDGVPQDTMAGIRVEGGSWSTDRGDYKSYAGPVRVQAKGKCIQFKGGIEFPSASGTYHWDEYVSSIGHCG